MRNGDQTWGEHPYRASPASIVHRLSHPTRRRLLASGLVGGLLAGVPGVRGIDTHATPQTPLIRNPSPNRAPSRVQGVLNECPIFPPDNIWNTPVDDLPVHERSDDYVTSIGPDTGFHPDFGSGEYEGVALGIPFVVVPADQPEVEIAFDVAEESDEGPYPIPADALIEGGSDAHLILLQEGTCLLYELYDAALLPVGSWQASSGARFDLTTSDLRPEDWTSADAAGLPILPGLIRYDEIEAGVIPHALRFTASVTRDTYVWPARHQAGSTEDAGAPPMGQRFRLKADVDIDGFSSTNQIILQALKTYGMLLADNGSDWFLSGTPDDRWDNDDLRALQEGIRGGDFEAVDCTSLIDDPDSGQVV